MVDVMTGMFEQSGIKDWHCYPIHSSWNHSRTYQMATGDAQIGRSILIKNCSAGVRRLKSVQKIATSTYP